MKEIDNISLDAEPKDVLISLKDWAQSWYDQQATTYGHTRVGPPFLIFSGVTKRVGVDHASDRPDNYGQALADFITKNDLGVVGKSGERKNFANSITVWVWEPNYKNFYKWYFDNKLFRKPLKPEYTTYGDLAVAAARNDNTANFVFRHPAA